MWPPDHMFRCPLNLIHVCVAKDTTILHALLAYNTRNNFKLQKNTILHSLNISIFKISNLYKCLSKAVTLHEMEMSAQLHAPAASLP
jgi:hypothetical protein